MVGDGKLLVVMGRRIRTASGKGNGGMRQIKIARTPIRST